MVIHTRRARPTIILRALCLTLALSTAATPAVAAAPTVAPPGPATGQAAVAVLHDALHDAPVPSAPSAPHPRTRTVSIERLTNGLVTVPVFVNGTGPYPVLLDTGAASTVLWDRLASRLRLAPTGRHEVETAGGTSQVDIGTVSELRLGTTERFAAVDVLWMDLTNVRAVAPGVQGIIGQDLLGARNFLLDYDNARLMFDGEEQGEQGDEEWTGERIAADWSDGRPLIRASFIEHARHGSVDESWRLVLDSAATHAVLFDRGPQSLPATVRSRATTGMTMSTHGVSRSVQTATIEELSIARASLTRVVAAIVPLPEGSTRIEDGLLPASLFHAIYFDNRTGTIILNPTRAASSPAPLRVAKNGDTNKRASW
jgi:predicted aspartyl protease